MSCHDQGGDTVCASVKNGIQRGFHQQSRLPFLFFLLGCELNLNHGFTTHKHSVLRCPVTLWAVARIVTDSPQSYHTNALLAVHHVTWGLPQIVTAPAVGASVSQLTYRLAEQRCAASLLSRSMDRPHLTDCAPDVSTSAQRYRHAHLGW
eukprot:407403-Prorocentrum_minimum.AAC.1